MAIIVPMHGELPFISETLRPLLAQLGDQDEMVLVDNGIAATVRLSLPDDDRIRVLRSRDTPGAAVARNDGTAASTADRLVYCDSDDVAGEGYVAAIREALSHHEMVGATEDFTRLSSHRPDVGKEHAPVWYWDEDPNWPFVGSDCLGIRREAMVRIGGFDEAIPNLEDIDLCVRAVLLGIRPAPAAATMHHRFRTDLSAEMRRLYDQGRASTWLQRRYEEHGFPQQSSVRAGLGWIRHLGGVLTPRQEARDDHRRTLAWKRGQLRGALDRDIAVRLPVDLTPPDPDLSTH